MANNETETESDALSCKMEDEAFAKTLTNNVICSDTDLQKSYKKKHKKNKRRKTSSNDEMDSDSASRDEHKKTFSQMQAKAAKLIEEQQKIIIQLKSEAENNAKIINSLKKEVDDLKNLITYHDENEMEEDADSEEDTGAISVTNDENENTKKYQEQFPIPKGSSSQPNTGIHATKSKAIANKPEVKIKKRTPPPIVIYNMDAKEVINKIKLVIRNNNFNINIINKNVLKVHTQNITDHEAILTKLKTDHIKFYSYTPKEQKPLSFIIKKLPLNYEVEDVNEAILNLKIQINVIKIIKTKYNWLVQVSNDSNINELKNIQYLLHCKVNVVSLKKVRLLQCRNCQRFNHSALNCNMPYRCVKCSESHEPGKCRIPPKDENNEVFVITNELTGAITKRVGMPVKCVNCGQEGHTANAKVCQIKIDLLNKKKKVGIDRNREQPIHTMKRNENISYASLLKKPETKTTAKKGNTHPFDIINKDCQDIFGKDFLTCLAKVDDFNKCYALLKTKEEKTKAIFTLLLGLKLND